MPAVFSIASKTSPAVNARSCSSSSADSAELPRIYVPADAASKGSSPCASNAVIIPVRTSPLPPLASPGLPEALYLSLPSGMRCHRDRSFKQNDAPECFLPCFRQIPQGHAAHLRLIFPSGAPSRRDAESAHAAGKAVFSTHYQGYSVRRHR